MINDHRVILFSIGNGAHTPAMMMEATGFTRGKVAACLTKLVKEGHVIHRAHGFYKLPVTERGVPISNDIKAPDRRWYQDLVRFFE